MAENSNLTRINKLDSFFLWVASFSGVGFSIFIAYLKLPVLPYVPIFILIAISLGIGYLNGAVFCDSFTNRMRGWNYFLIGLAIYIPLASIKFSETYLSQKYSTYANLERLKRKDLPRKLSLLLQSPVRFMLIFKIWELSILYCQR